MKLAIQILSIIGTIILVLNAYKVIFFFVGVFKKKTFKPTENKHNFGVIVCARNEKTVIENFLQSINNQDYPLDKLTVFVMAHNCTDETASIAREYANSNPALNVVTYEYNNPDERTKGYALKTLFNFIEQDYKISTFDGYFIFDADNVLAPNYMTKMNEAFDEGNKIITSFRHSKNFSQNWISYSYAMHWVRTCLSENRGKAVLNQACRIQGTGILFSNELVKDGWNYTILTEDRYFCTDAVIKNYRISYCDDAVFYDEQPYKLKVAIRQRVRWSKGHLQSTAKNSPKLLKNMFKREIYFPTTYDMFWINFPFYVEAGIRKLATITLQIILALQASTLLGTIGAILLGYVTGYIVNIFGNLPEQLFAFAIYRNRLGKMPVGKTIFHIIMFPMFSIIGKWTTYYALFKKVDWKPIPHDKVVDVSKLEAK